MSAMGLDRSDFVLAGAWGGSPYGFYVILNAVKDLSVICRKILRYTQNDSWVVVPAPPSENGAASSTASVPPSPTGEGIKEKNHLPGIRQVT